MLPKTNIYPKSWLVLHVVIWWGNKKTICLLFLLAGHDDEQNFMSKLGVVLTRSGICQCLCVGILKFLALVREAEQEWGSTWRILWLILDKLQPRWFWWVRVVQELLWRKCSSEMRKLSWFSAAPHSHTCRHQSTALLCSPRLTQLCSLP